VSYPDCRRALVEANGDIERAAASLTQKRKAETETDRQARLRAAAHRFRTDGPEAAK